MKLSSVTFSRCTTPAEFCQGIYKNKSYALLRAPGAVFVSDWTPKWWSVQKVFPPKGLSAIKATSLRRR